MLLGTVRRLRLGRATRVTIGHGSDTESVFAEVGDELRDNMTWEEARIGEHAAQRQGRGRCRKNCGTPRPILFTLIERHCSFNAASMRSMDAELRGLLALRAYRFVS